MTNKCGVSETIAACVAAIRKIKAGNIKKKRTTGKVGGTVGKKKTRSKTGSKIRSKKKTRNV